MRSDESGEISVQEIDTNTHVVQYEGSTIVDSETATERTITTTTGEGSSEFVEDLTTGEAELYVNGELIETYNMNQIRNEIADWIMPEEDERAFDAYFASSLDDEMEIALAGGSAALPENLKSDYKIIVVDGESVIIPIEAQASTSSSSAKTVRPYKTVTSAYPTYEKKQIASKTSYSSVCKKNLTVYVKDSWYSYVRLSSKHKIFKAGSAVSLIASAFKIPFNTALGAVTAYAKVVKGVYELSNSVDFYNEEAYKFYALRQGFMKDYTHNNQLVSVVSKSGVGKVTLGWTWNSSKGYFTNPTWSVTSIPEAFNTSASVIASRSKTVWENSIKTYGYWKFGNL